MRRFLSAADRPLQALVAGVAAAGPVVGTSRLLWLRRGVAAGVLVAGGAFAVRRLFMSGAGGRGAGPGGHLPTAAGPGGAPSGPTTNAADQAEAAAMRVGGGAAAAAAPTALDAVVSVKIDADAMQKYVLIEATSAAEFASKYLVRGDQWADYHKDAARDTLIELDELGVRYEVLGGGRIKHDTAAQKIEIYGFSYGFPWKDEPRHDLSAEAVRAAFPGFEVTTSDAGY
jgi:phosphohistidine phosphatase